MELTRKKAIELSISLWTWATKTGKDKYAWPSWEKYYAVHHCFLCEYSFVTLWDDCNSCPYLQKFGHCSNSYFGEWYDSITIKTRKKYAGLFLEQLKQL